MRVLMLLGVRRLHARALLKELLVHMRSAAQESATIVKGRLRVSDYVVVVIFLWRSREVMVFMTLTPERLKFWYPNKGLYHPQE